MRNKNPIKILSFTISKNKKKIILALTKRDNIVYLEEGLQELIADQKNLIKKYIDDYNNFYRREIVRYPQDILEVHFQHYYNMKNALIKLIKNSDFIIKIKEICKKDVEILTAMQEFLNFIESGDKVFCEIEAFIKIEEVKQI